MWVTMGLAVGAVVLFATEWVSLELVALGLLVALLALFHVAPVPGLDATGLLSGFGNPALLTVLALLVVGEGLVQTGALDRVAAAAMRLRLKPTTTLALSLVFVAVISAFLNNTPVVVIFLPIVQALAGRAGLHASRVLMGLSFAAILGGMTTVIGSSTNLLVSSALIGLGHAPLGFFEFTGIGALLAAVGLVWVLGVMPRLLPDRAQIGQSANGSGRQFVSHATVPEGSPLVGERPVAGMFRRLPDMTVHMIRRGEQAVLPPFDGMALEPGDMLILAAPRHALADAAVRHPGLLQPPEHPAETGPEVLIEAMVRPNSRIVGQTLQNFDFIRRFGCTVLGIQRRARMLREPMTMIRLEPGDVLLIQGGTDSIEALRAERDVVVVSGSATELPKPHHAVPATAIFLVAVGLAAVGVVPIVLAAIAAAAGLLAVGALNMRQARRAIDHRVALLVAAALALGEALEATGGAAFVAREALSLVGEDNPRLTLSLFFLVVALITNVLSNNACAVLFTPIGVGLATRMGMDPHIFAIAVLLASNCSFATPVGYQTNLLVMGPGHYRFVDFVRSGLPLT
ncbi:MAG: SLC13 family permease, partial [Alphaproteobacteria bacterium]|nr:SLC13 family permease [Alphaproteobacteria bacterium]